MYVFETRFAQPPSHGHAHFRSEVIRVLEITRVHSFCQLASESPHVCQLCFGARPLIWLVIRQEHQGGGFRVERLRETRVL
jgi:hypothetical protein